MMGEIVIESPRRIGEYYDNEYKKKETQND